MQSQEKLRMNEKKAQISSQWSHGPFAQSPGLNQLSDPVSSSQEESEGQKQDSVVLWQVYPEWFPKGSQLFARVTVTGERGNSDMLRAVGHSVCAEAHTLGSKAAIMASLLGKHVGAR